MRLKYTSCYSSLLSNLLLFLFLVLHLSNTPNTYTEALKGSRVPGELFRYEFVRNASDPNSTHIKDSLASNLLGDLIIREFSDDVYWRSDGLGLVFSGNQTGSPVYSTGTFGAFHDAVYSSGPFYGFTFELWVLMENETSPFSNAAIFEVSPTRNGSTTYCPNQTALFSCVGGNLVTKIVANGTDAHNVTYQATCGMSGRSIFVAPGVIQQITLVYQVFPCCNAAESSCCPGGNVSWLSVYKDGDWDVILTSCCNEMRVWSPDTSMAPYLGYPARQVNYGVVETSDFGEWNKSHLLIAPQGDLNKGIYLQTFPPEMHPVQTLNATVLMFSFYPFPLDVDQVRQKRDAWIPNSPPVIRSNLSITALEDIRLNISWTDMFFDVDRPDVLYVHFINLPQNGSLFILLPGGTPNTSFSSYPLIPVALTPFLVETNDTINNSGDIDIINNTNTDNSDGNVTVLLLNSNGFDWIDTNYATVLQYQTLPNYPLFPQNEIIWYNLTDGTDFRIGYLNITSLPEPDPPVATSETLSVGVVRGTQQKFKVNYTDVDYVNGIIPPSTFGFSVTILTLPRYGILKQWDNSLVSLNSLLTDPLQPPHTIQYYANIINSPPLTTEGSSVVAMDSFTFKVHDSRTGNTSNVGTVTINVLNHLNLARNTVLFCHQDDNPCFLQLPFGIPSSLFSFMLTASYTVTLTFLPLSTQANLASVTFVNSNGNGNGNDITTTVLTNINSFPIDIPLDVSVSNPNATTDYLTIAFTPALHWFGNSSFSYYVSQIYNGTNFRSIDTTVIVQVLRINHPANITLTKPVLRTSQNLTVFAPAIGLPAANASISATFAMTDIDANATNYTVILTSNVDGNEGAIKFAIDPVNVPNLFFISPTSAKNTSVFAVTITGSYFQIQAALVNVSISGGFAGTGVMKAIVIDSNNYFVSPGFYQTVLVVPFTVVPYTVTITTLISTTVFYTLIALAIACCFSCCWCCAHQHSEWLKEVQRRKEYQAVPSVPSVPPVPIN